MLLNTLAAALFGGLLSVVHSTPIARANDGARPISWQDPSEQYLCWAVQGELSAGSQIGVAPCTDNTQGQSFIYNEGATSIQVSGTNLCVEFGPGLGRNGTPLRLATCRSNGAPGQRLFITEDAHISLQNGPGKCADVRDAQGPLQSWQCTSDNTNQIFNFGSPPGPSPGPTAAFLRPYNLQSYCLNPWVLRPGVTEFLNLVENCQPDSHNQFDLSDGSPVLRDEGNEWRLTKAEGDRGYISQAPPEEFSVAVEAGTEGFEDFFRVVLTDNGEDGGVYCLAGVDLVRWFSCNPSDTNQYWVVEPTA